MISHKHKFIFLFQHKCAGISLKIALQKLDRFNLKFHRGVLSEEYKNNQLEKYKDYFIFTTKRNPFDRVVSAWKYLQKDFSRFGVRRNMKRGLSLKDSLRNLPAYDKSVYEHDYIHITENQVDTILDASGKPITDMLIRFENLQEDFNIVCDKIGIPQQQLPHKNKTKHKHYTEYYDDETRELVAQKYAKDIEYFGYEFGE